MHSDRRWLGYANAYLERAEASPNVSTLRSSARQDEASLTTVQTICELAHLWQMLPLSCFQAEQAHACLDFARQGSLRPVTRRDYPHDEHFEPLDLTSPVSVVESRARQLHGRCCS